MMLITGTGFGQAPGGFNYQLVLRNGEGGLLSNTGAVIQLLILQGSNTGPEVYDEIHNVTSNDFGLANFEIGAEDPAGFSSINWSNGPYFLKIVVNGMEMGTSQLLSVPYALYAKSGKGSPGPEGDPGLQGLKGATGDAGAQGTKGDKGDIGDTGPQGSKGDTGDAGPKGIKGDAGLQGPKGDVGPQGFKGETGNAGPQGPKGDQGDTGPQGIKGDTGDNGSQGIKGDTGNTGAKGTKGDTGDTGLQGPEGYTGPAGPAKCIAFGCIKEDGTILSGSGNFTCTWEGSYSRYRITISGEDYYYANYAALVTPVSQPPYRICSTDSVNGSLLIRVENSEYYPSTNPSIVHFAVFKY
ncbi:MAG: collagen-like protein [Bacteroidales bacterium]|nr:collagen-like protein [Bacteroidales bacterium]